MLLVTFLLCAICILLLWSGKNRLLNKLRKVVSQRNDESRELPPGPWRVPLLGSSYVFWNGLANNIHRLSQVYGSAFTVYTFSFPTICINNTATMKKVFHDPRFQSRPLFPKIGKLFGDSCGANGGIITCNGETWKHNRSAIIRHLRTNVAHSGDKVCQSEADSLVERINVLSEISCDVSPHLEVVVTAATVLSRLLFGESAPVDVPCLKDFCKQLMKMIHGRSALGLTITLLKNFPCLKGFPLPGLKVVDDYNSRLRELFDAMMSKIDKNENRSEDDATTFVDFYYETSEDHKAGTSKIQLNEDVLLLISDLYIGGTDTTSCTILHALRVLASERDYQEKIFLEIAANETGDERIGFDCRRVLHFTNAFIHEILRTEPAASAGISRRAVEEAIVDGIRFPKGVTVLCNIYGAHRETKYWRDPDLFQPERFLDEEGEFCKRENFFPFSAGKRRCPGEMLAQKEIFLIITSLVRAFEISPPKDDKLDMGMHYGFTSFPRDFKLRFIPRK